MKVLSVQTSAAAKDIAEKVGSLSLRMGAELAAVRKSAAMVEASTAELQSTLQEIETIKLQFAAATEELQGIVGSLQSGNTDVVTQLSEALGHIQFQDVVRQRVEQVKTAIRELDEHTRWALARLADESWDGTFPTTLKQRLDQQVSQYVMASQRHTHTTALGGSAQGSADGPAIELF